MTREGAIAEDIEQSSVVKQIEPVHPSATIEPLHLKKFEPTTSPIKVRVRRDALAAHKAVRSGPLTIMPVGQITRESPEFKSRPDAEKTSLFKENIPPSTGQAMASEYLNRKAKRPLGETFPSFL